MPADITMMPEVGKKAPLFTLPDDSGGRFALKDYIKPDKKGFIILFFYPKDMTPGCTQQSCAFRDHRQLFTEMNSLIFGISKDSVARHQTFRDQYDLNFPLLSDESGKVCAKYGTWQEKSLYGKKFMGIVRTTFIISSAGKIVKIYPNVRVKGHVTKILHDLSDLEA